jgi:hypothetical protein
MKSVIAIAAVLALSLSACKAGTTDKVKSALDKIHCKAEVLQPYAEYFLSEQFEEALQGKDYLGILVAAGVTPETVEQVVADIKACDAE